MQPIQQQKFVRLSTVTSNFARDSLAMLADNPNDPSKVDQLLMGLQSMINIALMCKTTLVPDLKSTLRKEAAYRQSLARTCNRIDENCLRYHSQFRFSNQILAEHVLSKHTYPLVAELVTEETNRMKIPMAYMAYNYDSDSLSRLRNAIEEEIRLRLLQQPDELKDVGVQVKDGAIKLSVGLIDLYFSIEHEYEVDVKMEFSIWYLRKVVYKQLYLFSSQQKKIPLAYFTLLVSKLKQMFKSNTPEQKQRIQSSFLSFMCHAARELQIFLMVYPAILSLSPTSKISNLYQGLNSVSANLPNGFSLKMTLPKAYEIFNDIICTNFIDLISDDATVRLKVNSQHNCIQDFETKYEVRRLGISNRMRKEQSKLIPMSKELIKKKIEEVTQLVRVIDKIVELNGEFEDKGYQILIKLSPNFAYFQSQEAKKVLYELNIDKFYAVIYKWDDQQLVCLIDPESLQVKLSKTFFDLPPKFGLLKNRILIRQIMALQCIKQKLTQSKSDPFMPKTKLTDIARQDQGSRHFLQLSLNLRFPKEQVDVLLYLTDAIETFKDVRMFRKSKPDKTELPLLKWFEVQPLTPLNISQLVESLLKVFMFIIQIQSDTKKIKFKLFFNDKEDKKSNQQQSELL